MVDDRLARRRLPEHDTDASVTTPTPYDLTGQQGCYRALRHAPAHRDQLRQADGRDFAERHDVDRARGTWSGVLAGGAFASYSTFLFSDGGQPYVRFRLATDDAGPERRRRPHRQRARALQDARPTTLNSYKYFTRHLDGHAPRRRARRRLRCRCARPPPSPSCAPPCSRRATRRASLAGKTVTGKRLNALGAVGPRWAARRDRIRHRRRRHRGEAERHRQPDRLGHELPLRVRHHRCLRQRDHARRARARAPRPPR